MSGRPLTESDRARILRLYDPRHTHGAEHLKGICRLVGKARCTVVKVLRDAGKLKTK